VFACGHNLKGELGIGYLRHVGDLIKLEGLSNYQVKEGGAVKQVRVDKLVCGHYHCMAKLNLGVLMQWGYNE